MHEMVVRTDAGRLVTTSVIYLVMGIMSVAIGLFAAQGLPVALLCYGFAVLTVIGIVLNIRQIMNSRVLFKADSKGVTDLSNESSPVFASWDHIARIGLKAAGIESLSLDVTAFKTMDELGELSEEQRRLVEADGGRSYYLLELSGTWVSRKKVLKAFDELSALADRHNPEIICVGLRDTLASYTEDAKKADEAARR